MCTYIQIRSTLSVTRFVVGTPYSLPYADHIYARARAHAHARMYSSRHACQLYIRITE